MTGTIVDFFGYRSSDKSQTARAAADSRMCPFLGATCVKTLHSGEPAGACAVKQVNGPSVICCPIRLYANDYDLLQRVASIAFEPGLDMIRGKEAVLTAKLARRRTIAVFGKGWGGELHLPQKSGVGSYFVDWILALLDEEGELVEFVAIEVQTIDTTGNYEPSRQGLLSEERTIEKSPVGLNWENVNKRILPQLVYKGQVLQRETLCKKGLFFVSPQPIFDRVMARVGGVESLPKYALQPSSITFLAYDYKSEHLSDGKSSPLGVTMQHSTTVYKLQEAFNNVTLPVEDVYSRAIAKALGHVSTEIEINGNHLF